MTTIPNHTEQFFVRNRWTNAVQFTAEISCTPDASMNVKLGLAIKWGVANKADLSRAYLSRADLSEANLSRANLSIANLSGVNLSRAYLGGANLSGADKIDHLLAIAQRLDGYMFHAWRLTDGRVMIVAGCRYFTPQQFRAHIAENYPDTPKAVETLSIIEHIERMAAIFPFIPAEEVAP